LLVSFFFNWYGPPDGVSGAGFDAWQSFELIDVLLAALAVAVLYGILAAHSPRDLPAVPTAVERWAGVVALVLVVVTLIEPPPLLAVSEYALEAGIWLALAGALLMTLGSLTGRVRISLVRDDDTVTRVHDDAETRTLP
jgi:hypothetical protein